MHCWGVQPGAAFVGGALAVSDKSKTILTIPSGSHASWYLPKETEDLCAHKNLHRNVHSSFIRNAQSWKQPRRPSIGDGYTVVCPYNGILINAEKT